MKKIENRGRTLEASVAPGNYLPFFRIQDQHSFEQAWRKTPDAILAHMAHAAYCPGNQVQSIFEKFGATVEFFESDYNANGIKMGRQAILVSWGQNAVVAFRGTEWNEKIEITLDKLKPLCKEQKLEFLPDAVRLFFPPDWLDNSNIIPVPYREGGKVSYIHQGFFSATSELWPKIKKALKKTGATKLFATGHSLGGAMAVVAGVIYDFDEIVTFGQPFVGFGLEHTIGRGCRHVRYINGVDLVPNIVSDSFMPYHGKAVRIKDPGGRNLIYDHSIINYAIVIEER